MFREKLSPKHTRKAPRYKDIRVVGGTPDNDLAVGNTYDCLHAAEWGWPKLVVGTA